MTLPITLRLPWPPSANRIWRSRIAGNGGKQFVSVYLSAEGKAFRADVMAEVLEKFGVLDIADRLRVVIVVIQPDRRKRDIDNLLKATGDALTHSRDEQIDHLTVIRGRSQKPGWLEVTIEPIPPAETQLTLEEQPC